MRRAEATMQQCCGSLIYTCVKHTSLHYKTLDKSRSVVDVHIWESGPFIKPITKIYNLKKLRFSLNRCPFSQVFTAGRLQPSPMEISSAITESIFSMEWW